MEETLGSRGQKCTELVQHGVGGTEVRTGTGPRTRQVCGPEFHFLNHVKVYITKKKMKTEGKRLEHV